MALLSFSVSNVISKNINIQFKVYVSRSMISFHRAIFRAYNNNFSPELKNKKPAMKNKASPLDYADRGVRTHGL